MNRNTWLPIVVSALAACATGARDKTRPAPAKRAPLLVDATWLQARRAEVVLVDMQSTRELYERGHMHGARHIMVNDLRDAGIKDLLPVPDLARKLGALGIDENTPVVIYDEVRGKNASWLWFTLHMLGHGEVSLLDEPLSHFAGALETGAGGNIEAKRYRARKNPSGIVDADAVKARIGKTLMIDARPRVQYTAQEPKKKMRGGHVEGAINVPYSVFQGEHGRFLPKAAALRMLESIAGRPLDSRAPTCTSIWHG